MVNNKRAIYRLGLWQLFHFMNTIYKIFMIEYIYYKC